MDFNLGTHALFHKTDVFILQLYFIGDNQPPDKTTVTQPATPRATIALSSTLLALALLLLLGMELLPQGVPA